MIRNYTQKDLNVCAVCGADIDRTYTGYPMMYIDECLNKNCGFTAHGMMSQFYILEKYKEYSQSGKPIEY